MKLGVPANYSQAISRLLRVQVQSSNGGGTRGAEILHTCCTVKKDIMIIGHRQNAQVCTHLCWLRAAPARTFIPGKVDVSADVSLPDCHQIQRVNTIKLYWDSGKTKANSYPKTNEDTTEICSCVLHCYMCDHKDNSTSQNKPQKILN